MIDHRFTQVLVEVVARNGVQRGSNAAQIVIRVRRSLQGERCKLQSGRPARTVPPPGDAPNALRDLGEHMAEWDETLPFERRLLLMPKCMRVEDKCPAPFDEFGESGYADDANKAFGYLNLAPDTAYRELRFEPAFAELSGKVSHALREGHR